MSDSHTLTIQRPPRSLSSAALALRLFGLDFRRTLRTRKTIALLSLQLLPVVVAAIFILWQGLDGASLFRGTLERVYIPLLLPLAALFYGGPTIVNEIEGRTITYLTLRPISRAALYLSKLAASIAVTLLVTVLPVFLLFLVCMLLGGTEGLSEHLSSLALALTATAAAAITYTSIFALLGVLASSTLLLGVIYYIAADIVFASLPMLEFLSVKFYIRTIAGFEGADRASFLENLLFEEPLRFDWWFGLLCTAVMTLLAIAAATLIFRKRQFHV